MTVPTEVEEGSSLVVTASHPDGVADISLYVDGVRVAEGDGESVEWAVPATAGETVEILAVARARIATVQRTGWPVTEQNIRARAQGWDTVAVSVVAASGPGPDGPGDADDSEKGGCGCSGASGLAGWLPTLLALAAARRRYEA